MHMLGTIFAATFPIRLMPLQQGPIAFKPYQPSNTLIIINVSEIITIYEDTPQINLPTNI